MPTVNRSAIEDVCNSIVGAADTYTVDDLIRAIENHGIGLEEIAQAIAENLQNSKNPTERRKAAQLLLRVYGMETEKLTNKTLAPTANYNGPTVVIEGGTKEELRGMLNPEGNMNGTETSDKGT